MIISRRETDPEVLNRTYAVYALWDSALRIAACGKAI
jgi:hypothetical protein